MISLLGRLGLAPGGSKSDYYADKFGFEEAATEEKPTMPNGNNTSAVEESRLKLELEAAKAYKIQAEKDMKELRGKYNKALKDLKDTDKKINLALQAQMKRETLSPLQEYSRMQRNSLRTIGLGGMNNKTSFALAGVTILLGITAIIGRVE